jgi:hypothetical protein
MINPESVNIFDLPSLPIRLKASLPENQCIYFVYDALGAVWYVGSAVNLRKRFMSTAHHKRIDIERNVAFARVAYVEIDDLTNLEPAEVSFIEHFLPPMNCLHVPKGFKEARYKIRKSRYAAIVDEMQIPAEKIPSDYMGYWIGKVEPFFQGTEALDRYSESISQGRSLIGERTRKSLPLHVDRLWQEFLQPQY